MKKIIAYFSIFALIFTMIFPPINVDAKYVSSIRKEFPKQAEMHGKNECKFQKLNQKIHGRDLKLFLDNLKKAKEVIIPTLSAMVYFSTAMYYDMNNSNVSNTSKHAAIAAGVGITSGVLERLTSHAIDKLV